MSAALFHIEKTGNMALRRERSESLQPRGRLITLEGGEGAGKSTQIRHLLRYLKAAGIEAVATREPGGSAGAEALREALLSGALKPLGHAAEAIVFAAARIDHIDNLIEPALAQGRWVISDRFADSTRAYQGGAGGIDPRLINVLERVALDGLRPDLTLILDLPPQQGLRRAVARRAAGAAPDRYESEDLHFHETLRASFLAIADADSGRCAIIDASAPEAEVAETIARLVFQRFLDRNIGNRASGD